MALTALYLLTQWSTSVMMMETNIEFTNEGMNIYGIEHLPDSINDLRHTSVIFLHGWSGYRTGPHDMFVKMARRLCTLGLRCIRFDFRGRGYSDGDQFSASFKSMLSDMNVIINKIAQDNMVKNIVLVGICSGAHLGLYYIKHHPHKKVTHLVEMSSPPLQEVSARVQLEVNRMSSSWKAYLTKMLQRETYRKLIYNEINYRQVLQVLSKPFRNLAGASTGLHTMRGKRWEDRGGFIFTGKVLSIHAGKDPETSVATKQIEQMLSENRIPFRSVIIEDGNHSFYSIHWENEIFELVEQWLEVCNPHIKHSNTVA
jgi:pimeloyl-ACP methyl ester carboxylesterase